MVTKDEWIILVKEFKFLWSPTAYCDLCMGQTNKGWNYRNVRDSLSANLLRKNREKCLSIIHICGEHIRELNLIW